MKFLSSISLLGLGGLVAAVRDVTLPTVNFYSDDNCQSYLGTEGVLLNNVKNTAGPPGSRSGMFIDNGGNSLQLWGFASARNGKVGPFNPAFWSPSAPGACISSDQGIYAYAATQVE